jgi:DNA-binding response OmpR family regulator
VTNQSEAKGGTGAATRSLERQARVFIIDDDRSLLGLLRLICEDANFAVNTYLDAQLALDEIERLQPDVIVLDLEMPVMNGRTFYRLVRERGVTTPVLILSAYGARKAQQELGADSYIDKPFEPEHLLDEIQSLLP